LIIPAAETSQKIQFEIRFSRTRVGEVRHPERQPKILGTTETS
jgi:hypothetical protein